ARRILQEFVAQTPFLELTGQFENALKADAFMQNNRADILFLDIEMPRMSGLQYLKSAAVKPLVILTTAFPEYALEGYELDIIDYLLKPIAFRRFLKAVQKAKEYTGLRDATHPGPVPSWLFVRSERKIEKIELQDILYIESLGNYVNIYTENKKIIAYLTLKGLEAQLPAYEFVKIHQSFLVNFGKINSIEGNQVNLKNKVLPISRHYRDSVMQAVEQRLLKR
ncbi:MAG TPA: LytTR family DNA-binding domain-containing protein, partial [Chitinophagaceae bacterium]|nr:LytTR family DNA-binding domain-containing protein [Chitinophagaceae bacterium]